MSELLLIAVIIGFFVLATGYARACERLRGSGD